MWLDMAFRVSADDAHRLGLDSIRDEVRLSDRSLGCVLTVCSSKVQPCLELHPKWQPKHPLCAVQ